SLWPRRSRASRVRRPHSWTASASITLSSSAAARSKHPTSSRPLTCRAARSSGNALSSRAAPSRCLRRRTCSWELTVKAWRRCLLLALWCACLGGWFWLRWLEESYEEKPYHLIEDGLYLGSSVAAPPPRTSAVVNLCGREDQYKVDLMLWEPILEGGKQPD